jgi:uncharacterized membrane protein
VTFVGRFHPLLVHFPVAFLVLAGLVELLAARKGARWPWIVAARVPLFVVAAVSALLAAGAGLLLGASGGYGGPTFDLHRLLGIAIASLASCTAAAAWWRQRIGSGDVIVRSALVLTLAALVVGGDLGATLTHGDGYLTEHAPAPVRALMARLGALAPEAPFTGPVERAPAYGALVQPVLRTHCASCHTGATARGGLALDTPDGIKAGGEHGPVLAPGPALASELVRRVWLPPEHADVMPPRGQRPVPAADAAILRWWVETGASFDAPLADLEIPPDVLAVIASRLGPLPRGGPTIPAVVLPAPDQAAIAAARAKGIEIRPVADGSAFLEVRLPRASPEATAAEADATLATLAPLARHVLWLTAAGSAITDASLPAIAAMPNLTRLDVSRTAIGDAGVQAIAGLAQLESLNLYATRVTDASMAPLAALPRLRRVYVWETAVTPAGVGRLKAAAPKVEVVTGSE